MRTKGLVSVVTATYNMARYLGETLDSILCQDYSDLEILVVDDGSTDETQEILQNYESEPRVKIIHQSNSGQTIAKNRGIRESTGEFIAFCDADDCWRSDKLSCQIPRFSDSEGIGVVFSDVSYMDENGEPKNIKPMSKKGGRITAALLVDNFIPFPTAVVRGEILDERGGFNEDLSMSIDYDLWLWISLKYDFAYV